MRQTEREREPWLVTRHATEEAPAKLGEGVYRESTRFTVSIK